MVNGTDHANPLIEEICDQVPHFGDAWRKEIYSNPEKPDASIVKFVPSERLGPLMKPRFFSNLTLMTNKGPAQVGFEIPAATLAEAEHMWRAAAQNAIREAFKVMQEQQRRIIVPEGPANIPFQKKVIN